MTQSDLLQAASQLSVQELAAFVEQVTAIYRQRQAAEHLDEPTLLEIVQRSLPSDLQGRWDKLIGKRHDGCLTPSEYDELLQLTEQVEGFNVQRMAALSKLAELRGLDLRAMMRELNLPGNFAQALQHFRTEVLTTDLNPDEIFADVRDRSPAPLEAQW